MWSDLLLNDLLIILKNLVNIIPHVVEGSWVPLAHGKVTKFRSKTIAVQLP